MKPMSIRESIDVLSTEITEALHERELLPPDRKVTYEDHHKRMYTTDESGTHYEFASGYGWGDRGQVLRFLRGYRLGLTRRPEPWNYAADLNVLVRYEPGSGEVTITANGTEMTVDRKTALHLETALIHANLAAGRTL